MQVILELRLYAMYGRDKKILAVLVSLVSAEAIVMGVLFGMTRTNLIGEWPIHALYTIEAYAHV
jgi:hypothetical protein